MNKLMRAILATILLILPFFSLANDICFKNLIKEDMCALAEKIANEGSKVLPIKVGNNMSIISINSVFNRIIIIAYLNYTKTDLSSIYKGDVSIEKKLNNYMKNYSKSNACMNKQTSSFINLGGEIEYKYVFSDGSIFDTYAITSCE